MVRESLSISYRSYTSNRILQVVGFSLKHVSTKSAWVSICFCAQCPAIYYFVRNSCNQRIHESRKVCITDMLCAFGTFHSLTVFFIFLADFSIFVLCMQERGSLRLGRDQDIQDWPPHLTKDRNSAVRR